MRTLLARERRRARRHPINKACTALAFDIATKDLAENAQPGAQFYGIQNSNHAG